MIQNFEFHIRQLPIKVLKKDANAQSSFRLINPSNSETMALITYDLKTKYLYILYEIVN